jgi:hypothetical protein
MLILLWDVCSYDAVSCVLKLSEELAAVLNEQGEIAQVTQAGRLLCLLDGQKGLIQGRY